VVELSLQKSVCGSASGESKKEWSSFRSSIIFSYQYQHENTEVEKRDMSRLKNGEKTVTSTEQKSPYRCLSAASSVRNRRGDKRSFRFIKFSSSWDNEWFHTSAVAALHVSVCCQDYLAVGRFPTILKQQPQHWRIDMMLWGLLKELNKLERRERLKVLARIPEQWWEMNQRMNLKVGNLTYEVQLDLVVASIAQVPLLGLTSLCHLSLFTNICQIPDFLSDSVKSHATTVSYVI